MGLYYIMLFIEWCVHTRQGGGRFLSIDEASWGEWALRHSHSIILNECYICTKPDEFFPFII